eukprot:3608831-Heterocapsa_arctica.AAC.1
MVERRCTCCWQDIRRCARYHAKQRSSKCKGQDVVEQHPKSVSHAAAKRQLDPYPSGAKVFVLSSLHVRQVEPDESASRRLLAVWSESEEATVS